MVRKVQIPKGEARGRGRGARAVLYSSQENYFRKRVYTGKVEIMLIQESDIKRDSRHMDFWKLSIPRCHE